MTKPVIKDFESLIQVMLDTPEKEIEERLRLARLFRVYFNAKANPPEGIIGVGAITYAEQMLQRSQQEQTA